MVNGYTWELYNLAQDYSEYNDLARKMPDKLRDMKELFLLEAQKYNVFPLDNSFLTRAASPTAEPILREGPSSITRVYRSACPPAMPPIIVGKS